MQKEKVFFFVDYANVNRAIRENKRHLDYQHLLQYVSEGRFLAEAYCYVPLNPRNEHRLDGEIEELWHSGYIVTTKKGTVAGGSYKCNFDVEIATDILKVVHQAKPDIVVLASGDSDFLPLIQEVRKLGVRFEIAAFGETVGAEVLLKCSGFIDLDVYYESYLAEQQAEPEEERIEEQYEKLIQAQNAELDEEDRAEQAQDVPAPQTVPLKDEDAHVSASQVKDDSSLSVIDMITDLEL